MISSGGGDCCGGGFDVSDLRGARSGLGKKTEKRERKWWGGVGRSGWARSKHTGIGKSTLAPLPKPRPLLSMRASPSTIPVVQMALQTDKNDFRVTSAFHSRYRYRRK